MTCAILYSGSIHQEFINAEFHQMWRAPDVTRTRCGAQPMWRAPDVTSTRCGAHPMWWAPDVTSTRCGAHPMWWAPDVTSIRCDEHQMWRAPYVTYSLANRHFGLLGASHMSRRYTWLTPAWSILLLLHNYQSPRQYGHLSNHHITFSHVIQQLDTMAIWWYGIFNVLFCL